MTKVQFYDKVEDGLLRFAVIIARSGNKWVFCKHRERDTYEVPGGHREPGEKIDDTARRELYEETGAVKYTLQPVCVYSVTAPDNFNGQESFGMLYFAEIEEFEPELHSEIEKIILTKELPERWTYPEIQPKLLEEAKRRGILKKVYLDRTAGEAVSVCIRDAEVIPAGTTICSMSVKHRNAEYDRWEREYGICFIFDDMQVEVPFYAVPQADIFAVDGQGGYLGTVGQGTDLEGDAPICYFKDGKCYLTAENGPDFVKNAADWRSHLGEYSEVTMYESREQATRMLPFISVNIDLSGQLL